MPQPSDDVSSNAPKSSIFLKATGIIAGSVLLIFLLFLACMGVLFFLEIPFRLVLGWALFLKEKLPQIRPDWSALAIGILAYFISWGVLIGLISRYRTYLPERVGQHRTRTAGVALLGFMCVFLVGISLIGIVHQIAWMSKDRLLTSSFVDIIGSMNTKKQLENIGVAVHTYHDSNETFPAGIIYSEDGQALHSLWTQLLPYLDHDELFERIDFNTPWDSDENLKTFSQELSNIEVKQYDNQIDVKYVTHRTGIELPAAPFAANIRIFPRNHILSLSDITDGTTRTLMFGEVVENLEPWGQPGHLRDPVLGINKHPYGFGANWKSHQVNFLFCDGHVATLSEAIDPDVLKKLSTPNAGEEIPEDF